MVSFLTAHILNKISEETKKILNETGSKASFIFFDTPIRDGRYLIDRVNKISPFEYDKVLPISWYVLTNLTILEIYNKLKNREVK
jgi:hypothetical protein